MLNIRLTVSLYVLVVLLLLYLVHKMRSKKVDIRYILPWLLLDFILFLAVTFPNVIGAVCRFLGIRTPSNMVFFFGIIFLLFIVFSLTLTVSKLNGDIKELTQRIALGETEKAEKNVAGSSQEGLKSEM